MKMRNESRVIFRGEVGRCVDRRTQLEPKSRTILRISENCILWFIVMFSNPAFFLTMGIIHAGPILAMCLPASPHPNMDFPTLVINITSSTRAHRASNTMHQRRKIPGNI